jgi:FMN phosphatase YigB (HAD superfamily)
MMSPITYIFDVDGTLTAERYENDEVDDLLPNYPILEVARSLKHLGNHNVAIVTARPDYLYNDTIGWLKNNGLDGVPLLMRDAQDKRPDYLVRVDQVRQLVKLFGSRAILFDDKLDNCLHVKGKLGVPYIRVKNND